jgi:hypothetical protein
MTEKPNNLIELIYIGNRIINPNKRGFKYLVNGDDVGAEELLFKQQLYPGMTLGSIVSIEKTPTGVKGNATAIGYVDTTHPLFSHMVFWSAQDRAAKDQIANSRMVKAEHTGTIDSIIKELKESIHYMPTTKKAAVARYVFEQLIK